MTVHMVRLRAAFPDETYPNTLRALREGVALADEVIKSIPIFDTPVGRDLRGLVRRAGVLHRLHSMCTTGELPFVSEVRPMPRGSWHWLEIHSANVVAHPVRTEDAVSFPEDTPNRQDQRLRNQRDLFEDDKVVPISGDVAVYAWLCYGVTRNGAITHACWSMPSAEQDEWLARINMTFALPDVTSIEPSAKPAKVDPAEALTFREEVLGSLESDMRGTDEQE